MPAGAGWPARERQGSDCNKMRGFIYLVILSLVYFYSPGWLLAGVRAVPVWGLWRGHPGDAPKAFSSFAGQG